MAINKEKKARPLTHDLIGNIFQGFGIELDRVVINDFNKEFYFARIILKMKNELGVKIVEIDSRPSDALAVALRMHSPILVADEVMDEAIVWEEDMQNIEEEIQQEPKIDILEKQLKKAIDKEEYEIAARIRDKIKNIDD